MNLEELITQCLKSNAGAQKKLFESYAPKLYAICYRYASDTYKAQDILQDSFVKIFEKLSDYKSEGSFDGWLRRIVVNTALDQLRRDKKFSLQSSIEGVQTKFSPAENASIEAEMGAQDLLLILDKLPIGYKTVFNLYAIEGYSHKEIADELNITVSTSKSQYSRARSILRELIEKQGITNES